MPWRAWLPDESPRVGRSIALGAMLAILGAAVRLALPEPLAGELPFVTYFPALVVAAAVGGYAGGIACLVVASLTSLWPLGEHEGAKLWTLVSFWIAGGVVIAVGAALSDTVRKLRHSEATLSGARADLQTMVGELAHRNRNALFVIMSIVSQSARSVNSAPEAEAIINARLHAMVRAQEALEGGERRSARLRNIVERAVEPFGLERFEIGAAPDFVLDGDVAVGLGLLFHELATNAVKYGALANETGRVRGHWTVEAGSARLLWKELGGPALDQPGARKGFGSRLIDAALAPQGGKAERRFEADGVACELHIPPPSKSPPTSTPGARFAAAADADGA